ncbi:MAG: 3-deoxy-8-phosphooctulonate synthase [Candidatus Ancaeobacter aquaticus]|nr:3-deoxy-8-phosphooctulonate synthase [Candidatus Ancaeobacter aquaticus]
MKPKRVKIGNVVIGQGAPLTLIAGPCVIESQSHCLKIAQALKDITRELNISYVFKASYDKANRSSVSSYRGPGMTKGLAILSKIKEKVDVPVLTDIHCKEELSQVARVADIIQIPAFLSRQTDLIIAAAATGKPINIKKGQFLAPWDMKNVIEKAETTGNKNITLTERGVSFGYNTLVTDMRSLVIMRDFGYPVIFDATHSVQQPGGNGNCSGGDRRFVPYLSRAAIAVGCDGLFLEVHDKPEKALCDGPNSLPLNMVKKLLKDVVNIDGIVRGQI